MLPDVLEKTRGDQGAIAVNSTNDTLTKSITWDWKKNCRGPRKQLYVITLLIRHVRKTLVK